jgi:hypothetical protein
MIMVYFSQNYLQNHIQKKQKVICWTIFMASGVDLTPLPEVYTLWGNGGGIRT